MKRGNEFRFEQFPKFPDWPGLPALQPPKQKGMTLIKLMGIIMVVGFIAAIAWYTLVGLFVIKAVEHVDQHGLKSVVERVWEGPPKDQK